MIGTEISEPQQVTDENLHQYIAGIVIADDVSARDVQLSQGQWLKGKSYRTFCPTGPYLYLLDKEEIPKIHDLELNLWVNDELRQSANSSQFLFKPAETIRRAIRNYGSRQRRLNSNWNNRWGSVKSYQQK